MSLDDTMCRIQTNVPADDDILFSIPGQETLEGRPRAQIIPPEVTVDHPDVFCRLEHPVIHRYLLQRGVDCCQDIGVRRRSKCGPNLLESRPVGRQMALEQLLKRPILPYEDPGIPKVVPCRHKAPGRLGVGLFAKSKDRIDILKHLRPNVHIPVTRLRAIWPYPDNNGALSLLGKRDRLFKRGAERRGPLDAVIGRADHGNRIRISTLKEHGAQANTGGRISPHGLADEITRGQLRQLLVNASNMPLAGHHDLPVNGNQGLDPFDRPPEESLSAQETEKLFGRIGCAQGPEQLPGTYRHDNRINMMVHCVSWVSWVRSHQSPVTNHQSVASQLPSLVAS